MAIAHVQSKAGATTGASGNSTSQTFNSSTTTGNLIVVAVSSYGASQTVSSVTDNKSNTYNKIGSTIYSPDNDSLEIWYCANANGGASHQITVTMGQTENIGLAIHEYSGVDTTSPYDTGNTGTGTSSTSATSSFTPSQNDSLIFVAGVDQRLATTSVTASTNYTLRTMAGTADNSVRIYSSERILATAASQTPGFSIGTSTFWAVRAAVFKPAAGAPSPSPVLGSLGLLGVGR